MYGSKVDAKGKGILWAREKELFFVSREKIFRLRGKRGFSNVFVYGLLI